MNAVAIMRIGLRMIGAIAALFGLSMLFFGAVFFLPAALKDGMDLSIVFAVIILSIGLALVWIGSAACLSLSPKSVRELFGLGAFFAVGSVASRLDRFLTSDSAEIGALVFFGSLLAVYGLYRVVTGWLCRWLFPHPTPPPPAAG